MQTRCLLPLLAALALAALAGPRSAEAIPCSTSILPESNGSTYEPFRRSNLFSSVSSHDDYTNSDGAQAVRQSAIYCNDGQGMLDVAVSCHLAASTVSAPGAGLDRSASAFASYRVRVTPRPGAPVTAGPFPVVIDYAMSLGATSEGRGGGGANTELQFGSRSIVCFTRSSGGFDCLDPSNDRRYPSAARLHFDVPSLDPVPITMRATARCLISGNWGPGPYAAQQGEGHAVVDPSVQVDPSWPHAAWFFVEYFDEGAGVWRESRPSPIDYDGDGATGGGAGPDCNDFDPAVRPGAVDVCGDGRDQDCDGVDRACVPTPPSATLASLPAATNVPALTVTGAVDDDAPLADVTLTLNGAVVASLGPSPQGPVAAPITLAEGRNVITLRARGADGVEATATREVLLDTAPPAVELAAPPVYVRDARITVAGRALDNDALASVTVQVNDGPGASVAPSADGALVASVALAEGPNTVVLRVVDRAGNVSATSVGVTLDTAAPSLAILSPTSGAAVGEAQVEVAARFDDASPVTVTGAGAVFAQGAAGAVVARTVSLPAEGPNVVTVRAVDAAGNAVEATVTVLVALAAPVVDLGVAGGSAFGRLPGDALTVNLRVDSLAATTARFASGAAASLPRGGGVHTASLPLAEGVNHLAVTVTDELGRATSSAADVLYDVTAPEAAFTAAPTAPARGAAEFTFEADDALTGVSTVSFTLDGAPVTSDGSGPWTVVVDGAALADGAHALAAEVLDRVGNRRAVTASFTVDNTAPRVTIASPAEGATLRGAVTFTAEALDGEAPAETLSLRVHGALVATCERAARCDAVVDTTALADGPLSLSAEATDAAGNAATSARVVTVSNRARGSFLVSPAAGAVVAGVVTVTIHADPTDFRAVECAVDGASLGVSTSPTFARTVPLLDRLDGPVTIRCVLTDGTGARRAESATVTLRNGAYDFGPRTLVLGRGNVGGTLALRVESPTASLLVPLAGRGLSLRVPGGAPVAALAIAPGDQVRDRDGDGVPEVVLRFERRAVVASLRAGLLTRAFDPSAPVLVRLFSGARELGGDTVRVRVPRSLR